MELNKETWSPEEYAAFVQGLHALSDTQYRQFHEKIAKPAEPIIGIRIPKLRELAKKIAQGNPTAYLKVARTDFFEEIMLHGLVLCECTLDTPTFLYETDTYVKRITSWGQCDTFCSALKKPLKTHKEAFWSHLRLYLHSRNPWVVRVGLIAMLNQYMEEAFIKKVLARCDSIHSTDYYVCMAQAWLLATALAKFPKETRRSLSRSSLGTWTLKKTAQKARESRRVTQEDRDFLHELIQKQL